MALRKSPNDAIGVLLIPIIRSPFCKPDAAAAESFSTESTETAFTFCLSNYLMWHLVVQEKSCLRVLHQQIVSLMSL